VHSHGGLIGHGHSRRDCLEAAGQSGYSDYFEFCLRTRLVSHSHAAFSHRLPAPVGQPQSELQYSNVWLVDIPPPPAAAPGNMGTNPRQQTALIDYGSEDTFFVSGTFTSLISNPYRGKKWFQFTDGPPMQKWGRRIYVIIDNLRTNLVAYIGSVSLLGLTVLARYDADIDFSRQLGAIQVTSHPNLPNQN